MMRAVIDIETTGLNPLEDKIIAIGIYNLENGEIKILFGEEKDILKDFWGYIEENDIEQLIGFNLKFDWTFLKLRSLKHRIKIKYFENYSQRKDLRQILNSDRYSRGRLKDYANFFEIPTDNIDGSEIPNLYKMYLDGIEKAKGDIINHLKEDLRITKEIYQILTNLGLINE